MKIGVVGVLLMASPSFVLAQQTDVNTNPSIMHFADVQDLPSVQELPDPFVREGGGRVKNRDEWQHQREHIKALLLFYEYGAIPSGGGNVRVVGSYSNPAVEGGARREHILLSCGPRNALEFSLDLLVPQNKVRPLPVIITGDGNASPIPEEVTDRGYIVARFDRTQFAADSPAKRDGVCNLFPNFEGGRLAAWAWGYSRVIDYLLTRPDIDAKRIVIAGHSRGGKAVLLAGALDERVALTAPVQSGTGGASPFRIGGKNSESLEKITERFGYWFHPRLKDFVRQEDKLPFDQHFLLALVAPRSLLLMNAWQDPYMNPEATNISFLAARQVYNFLGVGDNIGSFVREGGHSFGEDDWHALLDFADLQLSGRPTPTSFAGLPVEEAMLPFDWRAPSSE